MNFDFKNNKDVAIDYVKDIQEKLPEYNVNIENVNDFSILLEERTNCRGCKGLGACVNTNNGYATEYDGEAFVLRACRLDRKSVV